MHRTMTAYMSPEAQIVCGSIRLTSDAGLQYSPHNDSITNNCKHLPVKAFESRNLANYGFISLTLPWKQQHHFSNKKRNRNVNINQKREHKLICQARDVNMCLGYSQFLLPPPLEHVYGGTETGFFC